MNEKKKKKTFILDTHPLITERQKMEMKVIFGDRIIEKPTKKNPMTK